MRARKELRLFLFLFCAVKNQKGVSMPCCRQAPAFELSKLFTLDFECEETEPGMVIIQRASH